MNSPPSHDLFTPFFAPWRASLTAAARRLRHLDSTKPVPHLFEELFSPWIPHHWLCPTDQGPGSRQRKWPVRLSFWTFLAQVLSPGSSCRAAVRQAQAHARLQNQPVPDESTSAYCQARLRLALDRLQECIEWVAGKLEQRVPQSDLWCGRVVKIADGTSFTAEDTGLNQKAFPQSANQKPGCGFPLIRLVGLFSLASGALLGYVTGSGLDSELALAGQLWELLKPGEVLLADRFFGCFRVLAMVRAIGADAVCRLNATRKVDFRCGKRSGPLDRQLIWNRPKEVPPGMTPKQWLGLPATLAVRLVRFRIAQKGFRTRRVTLVTTLLDAEKYPVSALAQLYFQRWQIELSFRQIKTALAMEHLAVCSPAMIARSLAMHLLAYQLIRALMQEAALVWGVPLGRISFQGTVDSARHFAQALLRARSSKQRTRLLAELLRILAADAVPERPGRREPRAIKRRPKTYPKLNCPRHKFRDIPHRSRKLVVAARNRRKSKS